jgi:hypothetical protein
MKLKLFTIGLLATIAMTSATVEAAQRQRAQAQAAQELPQVKAEIGAATANLDIGHGGAHVDDPAAAINDLHTKLGTHPGHAAGDKTNHRIDALHTALGHKAAGGAANDPANKKVADAVALIQPGQPLHTGITNVNTLLGVAGTVDAHGKATAINTLLGAVHAGHAPGAALADIHAKLAAIKARLIAGITLNAAVAVVNSAGAVANLAAKTAGGGAITNAADIEVLLTEMGW